MMNMTIWKRLWPRRIGRRLALGFGALVALMLLALSQAGLQLRLVAEVTHQFATGDMQRLLRVQALSLQTEGVGSALIRLMNAPRENRVREYADVDERSRRIDGIIDELSNALQDTDQEETLRRLKACRAVYAEAFLATVEEVEAGDLKAAARALNEQFNPALKAMLQESNTLLQRERERIENKLDDAQLMVRQVAFWVGGLSLLVVTIAALLAWRTTKSVVEPLEILEEAAGAITEGNYGTRMQLTGTDEVDRVGKTLNVMVEAIAQREQQIVRQAYQDNLTGLPNRAALLNPVGGNTQIYNTLVLLDLARLTTINGTLGYPTGDVLIQELASRIAAASQSVVEAGLLSVAPLLVRLSGGTFALAMQCQDRAVVDSLREHIERALATSVECSGYKVDLAVTFGIADALNTSQPMALRALMRNAEIALLAAKRQALGYAWYSETQEEERLGHLSLVSDLRTAVDDSQLQMWLQPKYSLTTGRAVGAEALVRWRHPTRGFVSPAEFVPFAEQTGYITLVTQWMLREALRTLQQWQAKHPELSIAVNVSTRDLQDAGFAQRIEHMLLDSGVQPSRLRLEITESGLMEDAQKSIALLNALRQIGVPLSIDDFGTGYSSLAYLQKLPVSELKIDRSFIDGIDASPGTQKLVKAMIEMGHGLDLFVTAEGVETPAERDTITRLGCDVMQGYLASKPLHGDALLAWFESLETVTHPT